MLSPTKSKTEIKGAVLKQIVKATLSLLPGPQASALQQAMKTPDPIFDGTWYDTSIVNDFMTLTRQMHPLDDAFLITMGRNSTLALLNGVHRFLIHNVSPSLIIKHTTLYFSNFYRGGHIKVTPVVDHHAVANYLDYDNMPTDLWTAIGAGVGLVLETAKARNVAVKMTASSQPGNISLDIKWEE